MIPALRLENIPVRGNVATMERTAMKTSHVFNPLLAYDVNGDLIMPKDYDTRLTNATVVLSFSLKHLDFPTRTHSQPSNTFVVDVAKIRVLSPPASVSAEPVVRKQVLAKDTDSFGSFSKCAHVQ